MEVENGQSGVAAFINTSREKAAAVGERQQIAYLSLLPAAIGNTRRQHPIEQVAARGGQQPRTHCTLFRQRLTACVIARLAQIAALIAETLRTEIVGYALPGDGFKALIQRLLVTLQLGQPERETIGGVGTALQFALVSPALENLQRSVLRG